MLLLREDSGIDTKELEIGISGINLSSFSGNNRPPTLSGSSVSTNPEGDHSRQHSFSSYIGNSDSHRGTPPSPDTPIHRGQSMPSFGNQRGPPGLAGPFPSPIGKVASVTSSPQLTLTPSSSVDGHSDIFSTARHSPLGSHIPSYSDQFAEAVSSLPRGGSPWSDPPTHVRRSSSPFSQAPPSDIAWGGFGVYPGAFPTSSNYDDVDDDGLRGLGALRERAHSSPAMTGFGVGVGNISSSPPVRTESTSFRMTASPLHTESGVFEGNRNFPADPRRSRTPNRDGQGKAVSRPPLFQSSNVSHVMFSEGNLGFLSSKGDCSQDHRGRSLSMGTMNTQDLMQSIKQDGDFRANLNENYHTQSHLDQSYTQKFGSLPALSHMQHQRVPQSMRQQHFGGMQPPAGHVRSYSQPGPNAQGFGGANEIQDGSRIFDNTLEYSPVRSEPRYIDEGESLHSGQRYVQHFHPSDLSRSASAGTNLPHMPAVRRRNPAAMSHPSLSTGAFDEVQRQNSFTGVSVHPGLQRRDALDYMDARSSSQRNEPRPVMATREEINMFDLYGKDGGSYDGVGSGRHERMPQSFHSHSRHHSDGGGVLSSAVSQRDRNMVCASSSAFAQTDAVYELTESLLLQRGDIDFGRSIPGSPQFGPSAFEDELAGEFIDDPDDDIGPIMASRSDMFGSNLHEIPAVYGPNDRLSSQGHRSRHSFTSTSLLEQMPSAGMGRNYNQVDARHHASALPGASVPRTVYNVKFKKTQRSFVAGPRLTRDLDIGCYVKVEADRGEDLGIVVGKMSADKFNASAGRASFRSGSSSPGSDMGGMGASGVSPSSASDLKRVIRLATHDEVNLLAVKREEEEELLNVCRTKVRQRALPMRVVDAEYQFDRHKLTFFFEAEGRVDFRELVRDLFSMYKTRIWMQQLDKNSSGSSPGALPEYGRSGVSNPHDNDRTESFN